MDALQAAKEHMTNADEYRNEAEDRDEDERRYFHGRADLEQRRAIANAQIARSEAAQRQAVALERIADYIEGYVALYLDNSILTIAEERQARRLTA